MADQEQPMSLKPGGLPTSPPLQSPIPQHQYQPNLSDLPVRTSHSPRPSLVKDGKPLKSTSSHGNLRTQIPPMPPMPFPQSNQQNTQGARFPSAYYPSGQIPIPGDGQPESSSAARQSNGAGETGPRSRSSTFGQTSSIPVGQMPPMPPMPMPMSPQHSGVSAMSQDGINRPRESRTPPANQATYHPTPVIPASGTSTRPSSSHVANNGSKSPFSAPFTSPPRNRPNQLLIVNPTSSVSLTNTLVNTLRPILPHALEVTAYTASYPCPTAIDSTTDALLSSESCLRDLAKHSTNNGETVQNFDAILICNYSKHPLIDALRESYDVPIIGIMEASLYVARMLGARFGIITSTVRAKTSIDDAVTAYGLSHFFVGADAINVSSLDLVDPSVPSSTAGTGGSQPQTPPSQHAYAKTKEEINKRITYVSKALLTRGADTIILGNEFLCSNDYIRVVKDAVRDEDGRRTVNVIDSVEAGVMMLNGLVGMGVPTSKKGVYRSERDGRRARGQGWL